MFHTDTQTEMRVLTWNRARLGLPYVLFGALSTLLLLTITDHLVALPPGEPSAGAGQIVMGGDDTPGNWARAIHKLQAQPGPCAAASSAVGSGVLDQEKTEMMKLMHILLKKLNQTLDAPVWNIHVADAVMAASSIRETPPRHAQQMTLRSDAASYFQSVVTPEQKAALYTALLKLSAVCKQHHHVWMLYSGTLLGSFRHHDMVPWDDDFDIFMNASQRPAIVNLLSNLKPDFHVFEAGSRVKFWSVHGTLQSSKYPWKWPYLDISFFKENRTHIWDGSMEDDYGDRMYVYRKEIVFPLHLRPMGKYMFPAPRDSYLHLQQTYKAGGLGMCWTTHYSHKNETLTEGVHKIMCKDLQHLYPFVHRVPHKNGIKETLMLNGKVLHHVVVDEPKYAVTDPFSISLFTR